MEYLDILTPLYLLIILGFILKKYKFPSIEFWPAIERMTYYVLFPTLIFIALLKAPVDLSLLGEIFFIILIPTVISGSCQWFGFLSPKLSRATFTSMFQGAIRNNTAVSLVIASWLVPENGLAIMAVIMLIMIPAVNLMSIFVLLKYGENISKSPASFGSVIFKNPLIIACLLGLAFNMLGVKLPQSIINTAEFLGRSALPFALLAVGAGLTFKSILQQKIALTLSSMMRLVLTPLLCWMLCLLLNIEADIAKIAIIFCAMPTAVSSYILARQMGGDAKTMAQIITFQTTFAAITLPLFLIIAQQY
jgi:predicted permease